MMDAEVVALLQSPCSLVVATVSQAGVPEAARGWSAEVLDGGARLRVLLAAQEAVTHANIAATGAFAVTATEILTHYSVQVKGRASPVEPPTDAERVRVAWFCENVVAALADYHNLPPSTFVRFVPADFVAVTVTVEQLFDQTPGPSAGRPLAGTSS